jgi:hypothetical protein
MATDTAHAIESIKMTHKNILENCGSQFILDCYSRNKTLTKTAEELNVGLEILRNYFIDNNLPYDKREKYTSINIFDKDTEASFYWAGFIAADGNVEKGRNRIKIELKLDDIGHLEKFKKDISSTAPISIVKSTDDRPQFKQEFYMSAKIRFNSADMVKSLLRFNIVPNKSKTYDIPDWIFTHPLGHHFLRGLIDGDGWSYTEKGSSIMGLSGSLTTINKIKDYFGHYLNKFRHIERDTMGILQCYNLKDNTKIINFLLKDATIFLDRKHEVQLQILQIVPRKINITREVLEDLLIEHPLIAGQAVEAYSKIAEILECSAPTIKRRLFEYDLYHMSAGPLLGKA